MISTPFCTGTGFMKWVLMTREAADRSVGLLGDCVDAAILVMEMEEVFVARMACEGQMLASWEKMEVLSEGISGTASMTKSAVDRSPISVVGTSRDRAAVASSLVIRFLETSFSRSWSANFSPLSIDACDESTRVTGIWAFWAATRAMPRP